MHLMTLANFEGFVSMGVTAAQINYKDGYLFVPEGVGIGVEVNENKLKRYTIKEFTSSII